MIRAAVAVGPSDSAAPEPAASLAQSATGGKSRRSWAGPRVTARVVTGTVRTPVRRGRHSDPTARAGLDRTPGRTPLALPVTVARPDGPGPAAQ